MLCSLKGVSVFMAYADDLWSALSIGSYRYDQHILLCTHFPVVLTALLTCLLYIR